MFFNIINCIIKLFLNLFIISFSFIFKNVLRKKLKYFSFFEIIYKLLFNIVIIVLTPSFHIPFYKIKIFIKNFYSLINLNNFVFSSMVVLFIIQLLYFMISIFFSFFLFLKNIIIYVKFIILRSSLGFFIMIKKPSELLNIIAKFICILSFYKLLFFFFKIFKTYIRIHYILLTKYNVFLGLLFIYISFFYKTIYYLFIIVLNILKINIFKFLKILINTINIFINTIMKFYISCRKFLINFFFSIPIFIYIFITYFYIFYLNKYISFYLNKIILIVINLLLYLFHNLKYYLKQHFKAYTYTSKCISVSLKMLFKVIFYRVHSIVNSYQKIIYIYMYIIKNKIFILSFKFSIKNAFKVFCHILNHIKYIYLLSFIDIILCIAYIGYIFRRMFSMIATIIINIITVKPLRMQFIIVINCIRSGLTVIINLLYFHFTQMNIYTINVFFYIYYKSKQELTYFVQKTYICISHSIRQKMMLFMTPRQKFHFQGYPILRRAGRRIRIIRRYFRLQSRYVTWNALNHIFSILFFSIKIFIFCICFAPFLLIKWLFYPDRLAVIIKNYILYICYIIYMILVSVFHNTFVILRNIILFIINLVFEEIIYLINKYIEKLNILLIFTNIIIYKLIYYSILKINKIFNFSIYLLQLILLIANLCLNNIINIIIIVYILAQYIMIRALEIFKIIGKILYKVSSQLFYNIIIKPIYGIYKLFIIILYIIIRFLIIIPKQIIGIYKIILYLIVTYFSIPIKHILSLIQKKIILYYMDELDYNFDKIILNTLEFWYSVSYAIIGIAYYGTLYLGSESIEFILARKKKIFIIVILLLFLYNANKFDIFNDYYIKCMNELFYCMTLPPDEVVDYIIQLTKNMIQLTCDLSREFFLYLNRMSIELQNNILTYEYMYNILNYIINIINSIPNFITSILNSIINFITIDLKNKIISLYELFYNEVIRYKEQVANVLNIFWKTTSQSPVPEKSISENPILYSTGEASSPSISYYQSILGFIIKIKLIIIHYLNEYNYIFVALKGFLQHNYELFMKIVTLDFYDINKQDIFVYHIIDSKIVELIKFYMHVWFECFVEYIIEIYEYIYRFIYNIYSTYIQK